MTQDHHDEAPIRDLIARAVDLVEHRPAEALEVAANARHLAAGAGRIDLHARAEAITARAHAYLGDLPRSLEVARQALRVLRDVGDDDGQAFALTDISSLLLQSGDVPGARRAVQRGLRHADRGGSTRIRLELLDNRASISVYVHDHDRAESELSEALAYAQATGNTGVVSHMGFAQLALERLSAGVPDTTRAPLVAMGMAHVDAAVTASLRLRWRLVDAQRMKAELLAWGGEVDLARDAAMQAMHLSTDLGPEMRSAAHLGRAAALAAAGRDREARDAVEMALSLTTPGSWSAWDAARVERCVADGAFASTRERRLRSASA